MTRHHALYWCLAHGANVLLLVLVVALLVVIANGWWA